MGDTFERMRKLYTLPLLLLTPLALSAQTWEPVGQGCNDAVYDLQVFDDKLFAAGLFDSAGVIASGHLAFWDGQQWGTIGDLAEIITGGSLFSDGVALYVPDGGVLSTWDGNAWTALGGTAAGQIWGMGKFQDDIYVGGSFYSIGGTFYSHVALWNGSAYEGLAGGCDDQATEFTPFEGQLFVGGNFTTAGGISASRTALWNGSAWQAMGNGVDNSVYGHCFFHDTLYICGRFTQANGLPVSRVAKWNGTQWVAVSPDMLNDYAGCIVVYHDELYIGGSFTSPSHIARLVNGHWEPVDTGCNERVEEFAVYHDTLFIGGYFTEAGGIAVNHMAKWHTPDIASALPEQSDTRTRLIATPNLTDGVVLITRTDDAPLGVIRVSDALGHTISSIRVSGAMHTLDLGDLPDGTYIVRDDDGAVVRVVKVR